MLNTKTKKQILISQKKNYKSSKILQSNLLNSKKKNLQPEKFNQKNKRHFLKSSLVDKKKHTKNFWLLYGLVQLGLKYITNSKDRQNFIKKYKLHLIKKKYYTNFEKSLLLGIKKQKKLRRKRYSFIIQYKNQKLHKDEKNLFWNFFEERKVQSKGSCVFVKWHPQRIYTLRRLFRYFYGYLRNNVWRKAYLTSRNKRNRLLHFLQFLENRLSVVIFRMNFVLNLLQAKQFIRHGFIFVNKKKVKFLNFKVSTNDIVSIDPKAFYKYIINNKKQTEYSKVFATVDNPHMYVKYRTLTGIILYNPVQNFNLLARQHPELFFGQKPDNDVVTAKNIGDMSKNFKKFVQTAKAQQKLKKNIANPFFAVHEKAQSKLAQKVPFINYQYIISYFLKY
jgi:ribosomal protein S4